MYVESAPGPIGIGTNGARQGGFSAVPNKTLGDLCGASNKYCYKQSMRTYTMAVSTQYDID